MLAGRCRRLFNSHQDHIHQHPNRSVGETKQSYKIIRDILFPKFLGKEMKRTQQGMKFLKIHQKSVDSCIQ